MQPGHSTAKIFSRLFKSAIVQSSQPKAGFGKVEQRWIDQCSMITRRIKIASGWSSRGYQFILAIRQLALGMSGFWHSATLGMS